MTQKSCLTHKLPQNGKRTLSSEGDRDPFSTICCATLIFSVWDAQAKLSRPYSLSQCHCTNVLSEDISNEQRVSIMANANELCAFAVSQSGSKSGHHEQLRMLRSGHKHFVSKTVLTLTVTSAGQEWPKSVSRDLHTVNPSGEPGR